MEKIIDNTRGFKFTIIDNYILNNAKLSALEQIIYVHLKKYSSGENKCFPGINRLSECIDLSANTVRKSLRSLKEKGFIDIRQRFNSSNEYVLLPYPEYDEKPKEQGEEKAKGIGKVFEAYGNNINSAYGTMEREKLIAWFDAFEGKEDILLKAIEIAVVQGVRKIKYIESILLNWHEKGYKTLEQCEGYKKEWVEKREESKNGARGNIKDSEASRENRYDFTKFGDA